MLLYLLCVTDRKPSLKYRMLLSVIIGAICVSSQSLSVYFNWAPDKNHRRSLMAYHLFAGQWCYIFLWHATLSRIIAKSISATELMMLAGCSCVFVWAVQLAMELGFLQLGLSISRTHGESQNNPDYKAFHRIHRCGNPTRCRVVMKINLDAANLRPALEQRWALENMFWEQICYMFLMSKCRGDWDLGLYTFWVRA